MLLIQTGEDLYAIDARTVIEVLPFVSWRTMPHAPAGILGVINHHGSAVPVLDLAEFVVHRSSTRRLRTRIVVVDYGSDRGRRHSLGLVVERAIETLSFEEKDFIDSGIATPSAPYLGPLISTEKGMVQKLDLSLIVPPEVRSRLFTALEDYGAGGH